MEVRKLMYDPMVLQLKAELKAGLLAFHSGSTINRARGLWTAYKAMQKLPEPNKENTRLNNTHLLIDLRDEFFKWEDLPSYTNIFKPIWKFALWIYELDAYYRDRIDFLSEKWLKISGNWTPRALYKPRITHWREFDEAREKIIGMKKILKNEGRSDCN